MTNKDESWKGAKSFIGLDINNMIVGEALL
jgi:hypothetical protein